MRKYENRERRMGSRFGISGGMAVQAGSKFSRSLLHEFKW